MALGTTVKAKARPDAHSQYTYPVGLQSDWQQIMSTLETTDNGGSTIVTPSGISRSSSALFAPNGKGTTLLLCAKYDDTAVTTSPVVQVFGKDKNGIWQKLTNASGTHEITLTCVIATDVYDGTEFRYSDAIEIDMKGCKEILVCIKTAFAGTGGTPDNYLLARTI